MVDLPELPGGESLAAELALGLLAGEERAEALRRCLADPAFAAEVEQWSLRLSPLLADIPGVTPPPRVWHAVAARIGEAQQPLALLRSRQRWRRGAVLSGAVAASLALFIAMRPDPVAAPAPVAVSQLAGSDGAAVMAIAYDPQKGRLRLSRAQLGTATKSPELWVIPADGVPRSLGIIGGDGSDLAVGADLRPLLTDGVTLAITMEDGATAPHKAPSSSPIMTGKISTI